jgi:hypothetical protein
VPRAAVGASGTPRSIAFYFKRKYDEERYAKVFAEMGWQTIRVAEVGDLYDIGIGIGPRLFLTDDLEALKFMEMAGQVVPRTKRICVVDGKRITSQQAWDLGADMIVYPFGEDVDAQHFRVIKRR